MIIITPQNAFESWIEDLQIYPSTHLTVLCTLIFTIQNCKSCIGIAFRLWAFRRPKLSSEEDLFMTIEHQQEPMYVTS